MTGRGRCRGDAVRVEAPVPGLPDHTRIGLVGDAPRLGSDTRLGLKIGRAAGAPLRSTRRPGCRPIDPCRRSVGHVLRPRRASLPGTPRSGGLRHVGAALHGADATGVRLTSTLLLEAGVLMTGTAAATRPRALLPGLLLRLRRLVWLLRLLVLGHVHYCAVPA